MTETPPIPKAPAPGLSARAPRPSVVRVRRPVVLAAAGAAAALLAGALGWAFIVQPELRAASRRQDADRALQAQRDAARPSEAVLAQPATYDRLPEPRPEPRDLGGPPRPRPAPERRAPPRTAPTAPHPAHAAGLFFARPPSAPAPATAAAPTVAPAARTDLLAPGSPYELKAGAAIPAALLTALDSARSGPVIAVVTEGVFDTVSGRHLLVPQGSRLIGRQGGDSAYGERRVFLAWDRLVLPNGKSLVLAAEPATDAQGASGVGGRADRRLGPLAVASLLAGAITAVGQAARDGEDRRGLLGDAGDAAAIEAAQVGGRLIDRELQVKPSIRVPAGARVRVLLTRDLVLEPYRP